MIPINFVVVLNIASLSEKDDFYSNLNMKSITDLDYNHVKRASNDLGEYITKLMHLPDVFEEKCIYKLIK